MLRGRLHNRLLHSILVSLISTIDLHILSWQANRLKFLSFSFLSEYLKKIVFTRRMNSEATMRRKVFSEAAIFNLLLPILPERKVQKVIMSRQASYFVKMGLSFEELTHGEKED